MSSFSAGKYKKEHVANDYLRIHRGTLKISKTSRNFDIAFFWQMEFIDLTYIRLLFKTNKFVNFYFLPPESLRTGYNDVNNYQIQVDSGEIVSP